MVDGEMSTGEEGENRKLTAVPSNTMASSTFLSKVEVKGCDLIFR